MFPAIQPSHDQLVKILGRDPTLADPAKKPHPKRPPYKPRPGEMIGGGYIVIRIGQRTGRLRPAFWPMEYDTLAAARRQKHRLEYQMPGERFEIWQRVEE